MSRSERIAFAGTPAFAVPSLASMIEAGFDVGLVLTQPDRPAGRGRRLAASPVKQHAQKRSIDVHQPRRLDDPGLLDTLGPRPDVLVVVAYGLLLPQWLLDWPRRACINVHASLLPRWRGAAPMQRALLAGDEETGVSLMHMTRGLDAGPVYARRAVSVGRTETAAELHDRLAPLGAELLVECLPAILAGRLGAEPQDDSAATYAPKLDKRDAALDWREPGEALARRVRAFNPWPVAESTLQDGRRLRIWQAVPLTDAALEPPGTVVRSGPDGIDVATGQGRLRLVLIQPPGGKAMTAAAYLAAHSLEGAAFVC